MLFTSERAQTRDEQMASRLTIVYKTNEEISQKNEEAVPDNRKKATKFGLAVFHEVKLCLFNQN